MVFYDFLAQDVAGKPNLLFEEDMYVGNEFDAYDDGELTIKGLLQLVQENAFHHLEAGDAPVPKLVDEGMLLFVTRLVFIIKRPTMRGCTVRIKGWLCFSKRLGVLRYHTVEDENGNLLAQTASRWVCVDRAERKMLPAECFCERWKYQFPQMSTLPAPKSFKSSFELENTGTLTVDERFLDMNGHVNNCEYGGFVLHAINEAAIDKRPKVLQITYNSEARLGDVLNMKTGADENEFFTEARYERGICFRAKVFFTEVDDAKILLI